jgi:hypothetical protein
VPFDPLLLEWHHPRLHEALRGVGKQHVHFAMQVVFPFTGLSQVNAVANHVKRVYKRAFKGV